MLVGKKSRKAHVIFPALNSNNCFIENMHFIEPSWLFNVPILFRTPCLLLLQEHLRMERNVIN